MTQSSSTSESSPADRTSRRRFPLSNLQIILIALIIVGGRLAIDFSQRIIEGQQKVSEQRALEAEISGLQKEQQRLEAEKEYYSSSAFVEAWAHDQGKMVQQGERLVVPLYEDIPASAQQGSTTSQAPKPIPAWQIWWSLFFDSPPLGNLSGS